jgi:hypothetical protein
MAIVALRAEVIVFTPLLCRCVIQERQVDILPSCVGSGTTVSRSGDQGIVIVPTWFAAAVGLAYPSPSL